MTVGLGQLFLSKTKNPSLKYGLSPGGNAEQQWWWLGTWCVREQLRAAGKRTALIYKRFISHFKFSAIKLKCL